MAVDFPLTPDLVNEALADAWTATPHQCHEISPTHAIARHTVDQTGLRPGGFVPGPTQFSMADVVLWFLSFSAVGRVEPMALTSELSIRFLRPALGDRIVCRSTLESVSRRSVVATAHVWVDGRSEKVTATAQGTYAVPLPR